MLIVGASGAIGKRYRAVLNSLLPRYYCYDINPPKESQTQFKNEVWLDRKILKAYCNVPVLIATPTATHFRVFNQFYEMGYKEFLIEKPMFTHANDFYIAMDKDCDIRQIANYTFINGTGGPTTYDNFHAGSEKFEWNMYQLIALADGPLEIKNESPVWKCTLNGRKLSLEEVQQSYVTQIDTYLKKPNDCLHIEDALSWHFKVKKWMQKKLESESKPDSQAQDSQEKSLKK